MGIVSYSGSELVPGDGGFHVHKGLGLVQDEFENYDFDVLPGHSAIGHVRYTTAGGSRLANVQPLLSEISKGRVAIAHNGNLINADSLRDELIRAGAIFGTSSDTEVILHLIARTPNNLPLEEAVIQGLQQIRGAYSLVFLFADRMMVVRDPGGLRPMCMGILGDSLVFASETCALDLLGAKYERDIEPGELLVVPRGGKPQSFFPFGRRQESPCVFEYVYFARPDSSVFGRNVYPVRKRMGEELAKEAGIDADMVVPVPDSGVTAALGYAQQAKLPLELGLIRNHYVGRTFIEPKQAIRNFGVKIKLNANPDVLKGKRVVVVDDSIVRGTTSRKLMSMFRKAGVKEIHMRISAPPTTNPCFYGIDTPAREELIASTKSVEEIAQFIGVDSLKYLSFAGLYRAVGAKEGALCDACFSGKYPLGTPESDGGRAQATLFAEDS